MYWESILANSIKNWYWYTTVVKKKDKRIYNFVSKSNIISSGIQFSFFLILDEKDGLDLFSNKLYDSLDKNKKQIAFFWSRQGFWHSKSLNVIEKTVKLWYRRQSSGTNEKLSNWPNSVNQNVSPARYNFRSIFLLFIRQWFAVSIAKKSNPFLCRWYNHYVWLKHETALKKKRQKKYWVNG